jgi:GNAT superfamily N-acetyltransferase
VQVQVSSDHLAFAEAVGPVLRTDPVANTLMLGALAVFEVGASYGPGESLFAWAHEAGRVVAAGLSAPPHPLAVTAVDLAAITPLTQALASTKPVSVVGPGDAVRACAEALDLPWHVVMEETQYRLDHVQQPRRSVPGTVRPATEADDALLSEWLREFNEDVGGPTHEPDPQRSLENRRRSGGGFWLWDDGAPRCLVGHTASLAGVPRIGPVFTARDARGHGFGQALTADVCRRLLASGATAVTLFADDANPASNAAYRAIGFEPVGSVLEVTFD